MELKWEECRVKEKKGARILRVYSQDREAELPETVESAEGIRLPVLELADYAFSAMRQGTEEDDFMGLPPLTGDRLESAALPRSLKKIGRYAFYNCEALKKLTFFTSVSDLGAGLFTGCRNISALDVRMVSGEKSCLYEVLSELNQTLRVTLRDQDGKIRAKLLIPEYFEESVENTPARIVNLEMHGCGHRYRYCFRKEQTPFADYDALFLHVRVQEPPAVVSELAWYRLEYPVELSAAGEAAYLGYLEAQPKEAAEAFAMVEDMALMRKTASDPRISLGALEKMIGAAQRTGQSELVPLLMDIRHSRQMEHAEQKQGSQRKRKFEL